MMITSTSNPQVRRIVKLNTSARARRSEGCFAAEGVKLFCETPVSLRREIYVSHSFLEDEAHVRLLREHDAEAVEVDDAVFRKMCDTQTPQGILTVAQIPSCRREDLLGNGRNPLVMVLEDLQDPGNVGTVIRTAEGAGVTGVFMSGRTADCFQPKVIRSTMGSIFRVPVRREESVTELAEWLKSRGIRTFAAHLNGRRSYTEEDYTEGTAFLIGNEGNGLSAELTEKADTLIRIPMEGQVESLNAAVASALLMYEAHRQRSR
jgi:TrmH family RNA methyltransferase